MVPAEQTLDLLIGNVSTPVACPKSGLVFRQGDVADAIFYIEEGKVSLTVISNTGKEAILGMLGEGDFFGEGVLAGQALRMSTATALTYCQLLRVDTKTMTRAIHEKPKVADLFLACLLARNLQTEQNLIDQLFNSCEKRLARILLLLAHFNESGMSDTLIPNISQEALAEMVGTTRSRVNFFMNKFRTSGFIDYSKDGIQVHGSLLNVVS
jgi:CRP/FNR family transcriptional regulator, cyclic AMP receptor protein